MMEACGSADLPPDSGGGRFFLYRCVILLCVLMCLGACSVDPPTMPTWDVTLTLPVLTQEYTFADLADDEDLIEVVGDSLEIRVRQSMINLDFDGRLTLDVNIAYLKRQPLSLSGQAFLKALDELVPASKRPIKGIRSLLDKSPNGR